MSVYSTVQYSKVQEEDIKARQIDAKGSKLRWAAVPAADIVDQVYMAFTIHFQNRPADCLSSTHCVRVNTVEKPDSTVVYVV